MHHLLSIAAVMEHVVCRVRLREFPNDFAKRRLRRRSSCGVSIA
jgi:hypothetical protein